MAFDDLALTGAGRGVRKDKGTNKESSVQCMAIANRPANGKSWPQFQEFELMFEPVFPLQGNVGMGAGCIAMACLATGL